MAGWSERAESAEDSAAVLQKCGGLASFLLVAALIVPPWIYLTGDLRAAAGPLVYGLADLLSGPVRAACLVVALAALRERIGERAPRRMALVLPAALAGAAMLVGVACIRAANRQYLLQHPELSDAMATAFLATWGTIVAGLNAAGWHCLGWALLLVGSAGWTTRRLARGLSGLYLVLGAASLFIYVLPDLEGGVVALAVLVSIVQGFALWNAPGAAAAPVAGAGHTRSA